MEVGQPISSSITYDIVSRLKLMEIVMRFRLTMVPDSGVSRSILNLKQNSY